jgi:hypothetical protein
MNREGAALELAAAVATVARASDDNSAAIAALSARIAALERRAKRQRRKDHGKT